MDPFVLCIFYRERPQNKEEEGISVELPESELELDNLTEYNTAHNRRVTMLGSVSGPNLESGCVFNNYCSNW